jgi:hypothetical protein
MLHKPKTTDVKPLVAKPTIIEITKEKQNFCDEVSELVAVNFL